MTTVVSCFPRWFVRVLAAALVSVLAGGCGLFGTSVPKLKIGPVRVATAPDANQNSPVVLAVVVVADATLAERLANPEQKWFSSGADLAATYPTALRAYYCEFSPGQELRLPRALFASRRAHAVFLFAVQGAGELHTRIDHWRNGGQVAFAREGWSVEEAAKDAAAAGGPPEMDCSERTGARPA